MQRIACTLLLAVAIFLNSIELARSHKEGAIHPLPLQVHVHFYESLAAPGIPTHLPPYLLGVATCNLMGQKHGFGVVLQGFLFPFLARRENHPNAYERVKMRIDGNTANVTVPISKEDPVNNLFHKQFWSENVLCAEVAE